MFQYIDYDEQEAFDIGRWTGLSERQCSAIVYFVAVVPRADKDRKGSKVVLATGLTDLS